MVSGQVVGKIVVLRCNRLWDICFFLKNVFGGDRGQQQDKFEGQLRYLEINKNADILSF